MAVSRNRLIEAGNFLLGTFASNCSGGMSVTKVPERWDNSWANNLRLAKLLDDAGIDFMLPIARWIGYGGETNFHGGVLETMTWATGRWRRPGTSRYLPPSIPPPTIRSSSQSSSPPSIRSAAAGSA